MQCGASYLRGPLPSRPALPRCVRRGQVCVSSAGTRMQLIHGRSCPPRPQEVLLLNELESLLELTTAEQFGSMTLRITLTPLLVQCIQNEHSRVAQRCLQLFKRPKYASVRGWRLPRATGLTGTL